MSKRTKINPNADFDFLKNIDISEPKNFPKLVNSINLQQFRHIDGLNINFKHPITVISGSNKTGKTTILMAIACSHFEFNKRNHTNGSMERKTWSSFIKFTQHDIQERDWLYSITYKRGNTQNIKNGRRSFSTKKWSGVAKKESQIKDCKLTYIDIDRILPARYFSNVLISKSMKEDKKTLSINNDIIKDYISYVLEEVYDVQKIADHLDKDVFSYSNEYNYSSFNSASGEDVISRLIIDCVNADNNSLVIIDEVELGLHPKVQRRVMDVIHHISRNDHKQFIITTHSPTILSAVDSKSRVFIEKASDDSYKAISELSVNAALSKMDSKNYPVFEVFCEDELSELIIKKAISEIQLNGMKNFSDLVNIIISGSANDCYTNLVVQHRLYSKRVIKNGYACILDGDMRGRSEFANPDVADRLFFIFGSESPEKVLVNNYEIAFPNKNLRYHINHSDNHCLFLKMVDQSIAIDKTQACSIVLEHFFNSDEGRIGLNEIKSFLMSQYDFFSKNH